MVYLLVVFFIQAGIQFSSVLQFDSYFDSVLLWFIWGYFKFNIVMYLEEGQIVASMYDKSQSESDYRTKIKSVPNLVLCIGSWLWGCSQL